MIIATLHLKAVFSISLVQMLVMSGHTTTREEMADIWVARISKSVSGKKCITIVDYPTPLHFFIPGGNVEIAGNILQIKQENVSIINLCF